MNRQILAADLGLSLIDGALVRMEKPKKEPKPLKRGGYIARKSQKVKREQPKAPRGASIDTLDRHFSKKIRMRDCPDGWGICITCGKPKSYAKMDCGHYLGREYFATRWDPMNCAAQCAHPCNRVKEGLKAQFRMALVKKYGEGAIHRMEALHKYGRKPTDGERRLILARIKSDGWDNMQIERLS